MNKIFFFLFLFFASTVVGSDSLRVGMELTHPPFETIDSEGGPAGISVQLSLALSQYLGRELQIENIPFVGLIPALKAGKIDLIISSMSATDQRRQSIDFSDPYLEIGLALLVPNNSSIQEAKELDRECNTVVVKQGTTAECYALNHLKNAQVRTLDKEAACVMEIVQQKADAFIYDQFAIYTFAKKNPTTTRALLHSIAIESWNIALCPHQEPLKESINTFLKQFRKQGGFTQLADTYLSEEKSAFEKLGVPFCF